MTWYLAFGLTFYAVWQVTCVLGAVFGKLVGDPKALGLDVLLTVYLFIGIWLEERKLIAQFGDENRYYRERVPMLVPKVV